MDLKEWMERLKKNWFASAGLCVVGGLVLLLFPRVALDVAMYAISALIILSGILRIYEYFQENVDAVSLFQNDLILGLLCLGLGIYMITNVHGVEKLVPTLFGILLLGFAIVNLQRALDARTGANPQWKFILALAVVSAILGLLVLSNPFGALKTAVKIIGASLIFEGVADLLSLKLLGKGFRHVRSGQ
ncbi:MAG: DUF308 domain-containing protein [Clostridia bacterium]|nr:DUF308 domain-containing protein [Clostridia bacterium]